DLLTDPLAFDAGALKLGAQFSFLPVHVIGNLMLSEADDAGFQQHLNSWVAARTGRHTAHKGSPQGALGNTGFRGFVARCASGRAAGERQSSDAGENNE